MKNELDEFAALYGLSPRERDILGLLAKKVVNFKEIASHLSLSPSTVNNHFKNIFDKTGTNSKSELLAACLMRVQNKFNHCRHLVKIPQVLIVDDEPEICEVLSKGLTQRGVKVYIYSDPVQALEALPDLKLDVIISDIRMPKVNGVDFLKEVRRLNRYFPSFIFITGYSQMQTLDRAMDQGAAALVEKPIDLDRLFYLVMEQFIEDTPEKDRFLGINEAVLVRLEETVQLPRENLGYGGLFLPLLKKGIEPGSVVAFSFQINGSPTKFTALGEVAWKRSVRQETPQGNLPAGTAIKFLRITQGDRSEIHDIVRAHKILAYIPIGVA